MNKWILESPGVFYPVGDFKTYSTPGKGVFRLYQSPNPMDGRIGLEKVSDKFEFPFKVYDLGVGDFGEKVKKTWESDYFIKSGRNLGIALVGTKGAGKTLFAKTLCNELNMPVIIVNNSIKGMLEFIQSLEFECVIFLDEVEKIWRGEDPEQSQVLLKMIDGVMNKSRKLYIMTANTLNVDENLIGRPGRIMYIKKFGNITRKATEDYIADNLEYPDAKEQIIELSESLEVSTIDTLKSLIDEANIHEGTIDSTDLNLTFKSNYVEMLYVEYRAGDDEEIFEKRVNAWKKWMKKWCTSTKRPVSWAFTTRFNTTMDADFEWGKEGYFLDNDQSARNAAVSQEELLKYSGKKDNDWYEDEDDKKENDKGERNPNYSFVDDYLEQKYNVYQDTLRIYGSSVRPGMKSSHGTITKIDEDGYVWIISSGSDRICVALVNDPKRGRMTSLLI